MNVKSGGGATMPHPHEPVPTSPSTETSPRALTPRRVVVFGGAGAMGAKAVETLAAMPEFSEIVAIDLDASALERLTAVAAHVRVLAMDVLTDDIAAALDGVWGVVSALGPFTRFGEVTLGAAIVAGCHYVDINDDWEPTLTALEHGEAAAQAGVTALIGMGASPGVSNLLAKLAAEQLDETHELLTGWPMGTLAPPEPSGRPNAATLHFVHQTTGTVRVHRDSEAQLVAPLEKRTIPYPDYGDLKAWIIGHPEAVTLPRTFTSLRVCENLGTGPEWVFDRIREIAARVDRGELTQADAAREIEAGFERPAALQHSARPERSRPAPGLWAWAGGIVAGAPAHVAAELTRFPADGMAGATAIPAAIGLQLIARGLISQRGVVTPEEAVPPAEFFAEYEPFCTNARFEDESTPLVTIGRSHN